MEIETFLVDPQKGVFTVGVVADTHIPDRVNGLHPDLLPQLKEIGVDLIFHAGDISVKSALTEFAQVAPVRAVLGNRDITLIRDLPLVRQFDLGGVRTALMHGHGGFLSYLWDKSWYILQGYRAERYKKLLRFAPDANVIVFGHTHRGANIWNEGRLMFNPGSASFGAKRRGNPGYGILKIYPGGRFEAERVELTGWRVENWAWIRQSENENS